MFWTSLFNVTGVAMVVATSAYVTRRFPEPWFRYWTWAYAVSWAALGLDLVAVSLGRSGWLAQAEVAAIAASVALMGQVALVLLGRPATPPTLAVATAVMALPGMVWLGCGGTFAAAVALPMVGFCLAFFWLGWLVYRRASGPQRWFSLPLFAKGLLTLAFPLVVGHPLAWLGYLAGVVLNLVSGMAMIVLRLEHMQAALLARNVELEALDRRKDEMFHVVSHELRTPLCVIRAAAPVLASDAPGRKAFADTIVEQVEQLDRMLGNLLDAARLGGGQLPCHPEPQDLAQTVAEACETMAHHLAAHGHALRLSLPEHACVVPHDRERVQQVVLNLLENARVHGARGGAIEVEVRADAAGACFAVLDRGAGVPPGERARIFERFYQVDPGIARRGSGAGLGLYLCRGIIEGLHGGRLEALDRPGGGLCIEAHLPAEDPGLGPAVTATSEGLVAST
ncbi:MAG: HAMP domain-containing sensor histidine kinase [Candidatus Sericytochromatia bacterium]|nr:HAMP domain-containing sensor histidine kinase [Candidatus Sericytochromatia bacterium]